ncbi:hypothetical protein Q7504_11715 [Glaesserella parasuis]|nr:hypothetical protein [Glaesserella parasuis]
MQNFNGWKEQISASVGSISEMLEVLKNLSEFPNLSEKYQNRLGDYYNDYLNFSGLNENDISLEEWIDELRVIYG